MSYRVAVIGDLDTTTGMALAGATYAHVHATKDETLAKLKEFLASDEIGLILLTHRVAEELGFEFRQAMRAKRLLPLVLRIPDKTGYTPKVDELREVIRRTVGAEIMVKKEGE
ncbi:MAG: V-type ATP synthase subunit F [Candidatus Hodarchaeaceae archaeon]|nr:V-type ATP synthase subunit F [Candidatus Hodarchaeaceae archaeon]MDI6883805.1 V-type ATP synthase subunit F [Hadesarchaea archaeon]